MFKASDLDPDANRGIAGYAGRHTHSPVALCQTLTPASSSCNPCVNPCTPQDGPSTVLKVSGLDPDASDDVLRLLFSAHAQPLDVRVVRDRYSGTRRGEREREGGSCLYGSGRKRWVRRSQGGETVKKREKAVQNFEVARQNFDFEFERAELARPYLCEYGRASTCAILRAGAHASRGTTALPGRAFQVENRVTLPLS